LQLLKGADLGPASGTPDVWRGFNKRGSDVPGSLPAFKVDTKAPYAHPYYWAPFILMGNWL
jgi:CHAT domain-containing protein